MGDGEEAGFRKYAEFTCSNMTVAKKTNMSDNRVCFRARFIWIEMAFDAMLFL